LVAGRSLPAVVLVLTLLTSWIGAGSLFAGAENAYKNGFAAVRQPAGGWLGLLLIYFIAPRARKFAQITLPDLLEARYNQTARVLGTFAILFAYIGITSYQFKGGGDVLHLIFPDQVTPELGTFIIAAFVIVTTALAGMSSVAYMDVAIGTLVLETLIVAIAVFGRALYPTGEVASHPREIIPYTARHGLPAVLGAILLGAVFAKVISTASNYLFSPATNLINDVFVRYIT